MMNIMKLGLLCVLFRMSSSAHIGNEEYHNPDENGNITENNLYEGDIKILNPGTRVARLNGKWPNGIMYYTYHPSIGQTENGRTVIEQAIAEWQTKTCIKFEPRTNQADYVEFTAEDQGCYSFLGRTGGKQPINLQPPPPGGGPSCMFRGIAAHEIAHALGFLHEQSRPDRDDFIRIVEENIRTGLESQFRKVRPDLATFSTHGTKYDYNSIMHYGPFAFSANGQRTIVPVAANSGVTFGQRREISDGDAQEMNIFYECNEITEKPGATPSPTTKPCNDIRGNCAKLVTKKPARCNKKKFAKRCQKSCGSC